MSRRHAHRLRRRVSRLIRQDLRGLCAGLREPLLNVKKERWRLREHAEGVSLLAYSLYLAFTLYPYFMNTDTLCGVKAPLTAILVVLSPFLCFLFLPSDRALLKNCYKIFLSMTAPCKADGRYFYTSTLPTAIKVPFSLTVLEIFEHFFITVHTYMPVDIYDWMRTYVVSPLLCCSNIYHNK